jgi:adenylate cyclase
VTKIFDALKKNIWEWRGALITAPSISLLVILLRLMGWLQYWEWAGLDLLFRLRPSEPVDDKIVVVGIDEDDLKAMRQWPIDDATLARAIENIKAQNPAAIGLDLYRDLPVKPGDRELNKIFRTTPNLIGIELVNEYNPKNAVAPPPVLADLGQVAVNNVVIDADGKLRRSLLYANKNDRPTPSLNIVLAGIYLEKKGITAKPDPSDPSIFRWGKAVFKPFSANDGGYVNADDGGYQMLINYRGPSQTFTTISLIEVLENRLPPNFMRDRIVLIGATAMSLNDLFYTPYSGVTIDTPERTAGVEIQANLVSQILNAVIEGRPLLKTWSEPMEWGWIFLWSSISAILSWKWRYVGGVRQFSLRRPIGPFLTVTTLFGISYQAFLSGWWLPVIPAFLGLVGSVVAITSYIALTAGDIRRTFGRYLSDEVVATLLETPQGLKLGGERRKITILTSDLRGFTALSERLQPEQVVKILNIYLEGVLDVITKYQGTIDKFIGDGILVLFGAPTSKENDAKRAIACAVEMQLAMEPINEKIKEIGFPELQMGIGINTGEVVLGNIGSEKHTEYSVIGRDVNLAYRIESYTIGGQILISESTFKEVESMVKINGTKRIMPKGVQQQITIYDLDGILGEYNLFLPQQKDEFFLLPKPIPIKYTMLEGKHIDESEFEGILVKLSKRGAQMRSDRRRRSDRPSELSNIKLNLILNNNEYSGDIYAKVVASQDRNRIVDIYFTYKTSDAEDALEFLYQKYIAIIKESNKPSNIFPLH